MYMYVIYYTYVLGVLDLKSQCGNEVRGVAYAYIKVCRIYAGYEQIYHATTYGHTHVHIYIYI